MSPIEKKKKYENKKIQTPLVFYYLVDMNPVANVNGDFHFSSKLKVHNIVRKSSFLAINNSKIVFSDKGNPLEGAIFNNSKPMKGMASLIKGNEYFNIEVVKSGNSFYAFINGTMLFLTTCQAQNITLSFDKPFSSMLIKEISPEKLKFSVEPFKSKSLFILCLVSSFRSQSLLKETENV